MYADKLLSVTRATEGNSAEGGRTVTLDLGLASDVERELLARDGGGEGDVGVDAELGGEGAETLTLDEVRGNEGSNGLGGKGNAARR